MTGFLDLLYCTIFVCGFMHALCALHTQTSNDMRTIARTLLIHTHAMLLASFFLLNSHGTLSRGRMRSCGRQLRPNFDPGMLMSVLKHSWVSRKGLANPRPCDCKAALNCWAWPSVATGAAGVCSWDRDGRVRRLDQGPLRRPCDTWLPYSMQYVGMVE